MWLQLNDTQYELNVSFRGFVTVTYVDGEQRTLYASFNVADNTRAAQTVARNYAKDLPNSEKNPNHAQPYLGLTAAQIDVLEALTGWVYNGMVFIGDVELVDAVLATARAYLARGVWFQYDDTRFNAVKLSGSYVIQSAYTYRWRINKFAPEDGNSQMTAYTNCAAFTHDVYRAALGMDIPYTTANLMNDSAGKALQIDFMGTGTKMFTSTGAETDEEKTTMKNNFKAALQPGDIIVMRYGDGVSYGNGHAMLYVGDGQIIHSSGNNYNYEGKAERRDVNGTVGTMTVDYLLSDASARNPFKSPNSKYAIVRPISVFEGSVPQNSVNRVLYMEGIVAEKTSDHTVGQSVDIGQTIIFTFKVTNNRAQAATLTIEDEVPANTEYLSGGTYAGDKVTWTVDISAGETVSKPYNLIVDSNTGLYGQMIQSTAGKVGGVAVNSQPIYIAKTYDAAGLLNLKTKINAAVGSTSKGMTLANNIYGQAGLTLSTSLGSESTIINSLFKTYSSANGSLQLNADSGYYSMLVPNLYGGTYVVTPEGFESDHTRGVMACHLLAGDILVVSEDASGATTHAYMFNGANQLLDLDGASVTLLSESDSQNILYSALGYYKFAVIRPSMAQ